MHIYVNEYACFEEFGQTKITSIKNYEARIRNEREVVKFDGTVKEATEYVKEHFNWKVTDIYVST